GRRRSVGHAGSYGDGGGGQCDLAGGSSGPRERGREVPDRLARTSVASSDGCATGVSSGAVTADTKPANGPILTASTAVPSGDDPTSARARAERGSGGQRGGDEVGVERRRADADDQQDGPRLAGPSQGGIHARLGALGVHRTVNGEQAHG